jgi:hypothetical protein
LEGWNLVALRFLSAWFADQLIDRRHSHFHLLRDISHGSKLDSRMRHLHAPKQKRARAIWACPGEFAEDLRLYCPKSRGSKLFTGSPTAFWRTRADGLPLKGGAMYTPCFGGSSAGSKDISRSFFRAERRFREPPSP